MEANITAWQRETRDDVQRALNRLSESLSFAHNLACEQPAAKTLNEIYETCQQMQTILSNLTALLNVRLGRTEAHHAT